MPEPRPYPLSNLPRFTRAEARRVRSIAAERPLEALLDSPETSGWSAAPGGAPRFSGPLGEAISGDAISRPGVLLERADGARAWLELESAIAAALVDRTLGGEGGDSPVAATLDDFAVGILCYAIARGLSPSAGWSVVAAFAYDAAPRQALGGVDRLVGLPLTLHTGPHSGRATLWIGAMPASLERPARPLPRWTHELRTPVRVVAGSAEIPLAEWREVEAGDALMADRFDLHRVQIVTPDRSVSFTVCRTGDDWRVEASPRWTPGRGRAKRVLSAATSETSMTDDAMNELPLTLTLEVARFEISLGDLASLTAGELLSSGLPLDGSVLVRAGDRAVARGELVDIDGETGVRILEVLEEPA